MAVSSFSTVKAALGASFRNFSDRYFFADANSLNATPLGQEIDGTAAVVTDAGVNLWLIPGVPGPMYLASFTEQAFGGTAPQIIANVAGGGLTLQVDATGNDGIILSVPWCTSAGQGTLKTAGNGLFTVGTDAFYFRAKVSVADVSEADEVAVGFTKVAALDLGISNAATPATDFFVLNIDNGTIKTQSNLNNGGVSTTSTTQTIADAGSVTLEVRVNTAGVVKSYINGANPTVEVTNFTFDSGDLLMPVISVINDSGGTIGAALLTWEHGLLSDRGLESITDTSN